MDIARAVFVALALLGFVGLATSGSPTTTTTGMGGAVTNDGGSPAPPPDGTKGGKR
jgi:hypothetical protein